MQCFLSAFIGATVERVERLQYVFEGGDFPLSDDVQLWIDGTVVRMSGGADGWSLKLAYTPWEDPFAEPLDPENVAYIASHGHFVLVDVSEHDDYTQLIGAHFLSYEPRYLESGKLTGLSLHFETTTMHVLVEFDEINVSWSPTVLPPPSGSTG